VADGPHKGRCGIPLPLEEGDRPEGGGEGRAGA